jgi:hypothetical protein
VEETEVIDMQAKNAFWAVVRDCLVEIYGFTETDACQKSACMRQDLENAPPGVDSDLLYHAEPLDIASDIAGRAPDERKARRPYEKILKKHDW